jgi:hypothetical protein
MPTCRRRRPRSSVSARRSEESVQPLAARSWAGARRPCSSGPVTESCWLAPRNRAERRHSPTSGFGREQPYEVRAGCRRCRTAPDRSSDGPGSFRGPRTHPTGTTCVPSRAYRIIEKRGTGGGGFPTIYAGFFRWATELDKRVQGMDLAGLVRESARRWTEPAHEFRQASNPWPFRSQPMQNRRRWYSRWKETTRRLPRHRERSSATPI